MLLGNKVVPMSQFLWELQIHGFPLLGCIQDWNNFPGKPIAVIQSLELHGRGKITEVL